MSINTGPFELRHIIMGAMIIAVVAIAMFLLRGALSFGIVMPIWMMVIILVTVVIIIFVLVATIIGYLRYGSEGFLFAKARKNGTAVFIDAELGSDNADFALAEKAGPKDVVLSDEESGIKVDPSMLSAYARPLRFKGGLDVYIYCYYNFMPQSHTNHAAFATIEKYFREQCQDLNFLTIKEFSELISDPEHYLERNALNKLNKYFKITEAKDEKGEVIKVKNNDGEYVPKYTFVRQFQKTMPDGSVKWIEQDLDLPNMIQLIAKARKDISCLPICGGLIAGTEAFKYNSVAYSSQHLGHVLMLYYQKMMDEMKGKIEVLTYGIVALMILIGGAVAIYVISMAFGGGGK